MQQDFTGFVLVGGKSSRMGKDKFTLELNGETFLTRAVKVLESVCQSVKIVLNQTQNVETDLPTVRDFYENRGALGAIHAALTNCDTEFALILAVDLPFVTTEAVKILQNFAVSQENLSAFVPIQADGRPQPLCAVYRVENCLPILEKLLAENKTASVRDLLALVSTQFIEQNRLSDDENLLFNVNLPHELAQINQKILEI